MFRFPENIDESLDEEETICNMEMEPKNDDEKIENVELEKSRGSNFESCSKQQTNDVSIEMPDILIEGTPVRVAKYIVWI